MSLATAKKQVQTLRRYQTEGYKDLQRLVWGANRNVRRSLQDYLADQPNLTSVRSRKGIFRSLSQHWSDLSGEIDVWAQDLSGRVARKFHDEAVNEILAKRGKGAVKSRITVYSPEYAQNIFEMVAPQNGKNIAGVFTQRMDDLTVGGLRQAVVDAYRMGAVEGWTATRIQKEIQESWGRFAQDFGSEKFIDAGGRRWKNSNYLRMLTRTTTARVARESYNQTLAENGDDLVRVRAVGDNCPTCQAWDGLIISISGANGAYPSYQEALSAGMYHPNCDCLQERIDETLDAKISEKQAKVKNADWDDLEAVQSYSKEATA